MTSLIDPLIAGHSVIDVANYATHRIFTRPDSLETTVPYKFFTYLLT